MPICAHITGKTPLRSVQKWNIAFVKMQKTGNAWKNMRNFAGAKTLYFVRRRLAQA